MGHSSHPNTNGWLYWLAGGVILVGGGIAYMLSERAYDPDMRNAMAMVIFGTAVIAGICIIAATAGWWFKR